ncbi:MAG TPA: hypothetical protein VFV86_02335 [Nitrososphaeraceae archaeon]|nr:hypothetical protein [Nitrososphaeraceae archaeon]
MNNKQQINVDLTKSTPLLSEDGNAVFQEGFILRKVSKFLTGAAQDSLIPIAVFFDVKTGKPLKDTIPPEIWKDYFDENKPSPPPSQTFKEGEESKLRPSTDTSTKLKIIR